MTKNIFKTSRKKIRLLVIAVIICFSLTGTFANNSYAFIQPPSGPPSPAGKAIFEIVGFGVIVFLIYKLTPGYIDLIKEALGNKGIENIGWVMEKDVEIIYIDGVEAARITEQGKIYQTPVARDDLVINNIDIASYSYPTIGKKIVDSIIWYKISELKKK